MRLQIASLNENLEQTSVAERKRDCEETKHGQRGGNSKRGKNNHISVHVTICFLSHVSNNCIIRSNHKKIESSAPEGSMRKGGQS